MQRRLTFPFASLALVTGATTVAACGGSSGPDIGSAQESSVSSTGGSDAKNEAGAGAAAAAAPSASAPAAQATGETGTIVPLYTRPIDDSWAAVVAAKRAHPSVPVYVVVNPDNGPGAAPDRDYAGGMNALAAEGIRVLGYVKTGYAQRSTDEVRADIERWHAWYPTVTGIFFDEESSQEGQDGYYRGLTAFARTLGLSFTVGNPGVDTVPSFVGATDVTLIYESAGVPDMARFNDWHRQYPRKSFGFIPHSAALDASWVQQAKQSVGYIYVTDDTMPNPWDSVPSFLPQLLASLE